MRIDSERFQCDDGLVQDDDAPAVFRGRYSAFTQLESLDMSVLGRDITRMFAVVVDRPNGVVALVRPSHRYRILEIHRAIPR